MSDTGIGMTQEEIAQVFDEFYMGDPARSKGESFGLGLTIVRRIVEEAGGSVTAESPGKGQGTVFRVVLPAVWPERGAG